MKIHVLKDNIRLGLKKNSIIFVDDNIGVKAIEAGCAKVYCNCESYSSINDLEQEKPKKKSKE